MKRGSASHPVAFPCELARRSVVRGVGGMGLGNGIRWGSHKMRGCHANHLIDISDHDHETMHRNPGRGARVALGLVSRLSASGSWVASVASVGVCMGAASFCRRSAARSTEAVLDATGHGRTREWALPVAYETPRVCMMSRWRWMSGPFPSTTRTATRCMRCGSVQSVL